MMCVFAGPATDAVDRLLERRLVDLAAALAHAQQRGLVDHVRELGAAEARRLTRDLLERGTRCERPLAAVQAQDLQAPVDVGVVHDHLTVEAAWAQQCGIEDVGPVGGAHDDEASVSGEPVHLDEDLVERLLTLVVALSDTGTTLTPGGVKLVNEDDRRRRLACLAEEIADARGADADERLDEIRSGEGEERRIGFARDRLCEQGLAGAGRADEQDALRGGRADVEVLDGSAR